jgi:hypothetical protein
MMLITLDKNLKREEFKSPDNSDSFIERMIPADYDYKTGITTKTHLPVYHNLPNGRIYHQNFMSYLEICWNNHLGVVFSPDIIWQGLLCELADIVSANPEAQRSLFTDSDKKKELIVVTDEMEVMPLNLLIDLLQDNVPTDSDLFLPKFSTTTDRSFHAFSAAFADICSPFYNYSMLLCGIPFVRLDGTKADWELLLNSWTKIALLFTYSKLEFFLNVTEVLRNIVSQYDEVDVNLWKRMFSLKPCGSGTQVEVNGWIQQLHLEIPSPRYTRNYATHTSSVKYTQLNSGKKYDMRVGLFYSELQDQLLVPDFGYSVFEVLKEPLKIKKENKLVVEKTTVNMR